MDTTKSSVGAPAHQSAEQKKLFELDEQLRHELMDEEAHQELHDRIARVRRRLREGLGSQG